MARILLGERPERPKGPILSDGLWGLTRRCLDQNPRRRPDIMVVLCYLRRVLVDQQRYAGVTDIFKTGDATLENTRPMMFLSRASPSIIPFGITPTVWKGTYCSTLAYRLWGRHKLTKSSPRSDPDSDDTRSTKSKESWVSLYGMKPGDSNAHDGVRSTPSGSRDLPQRTDFHLPICGMSSTKDHHDHPGDLS